MRSLGAGFAFVLLTFSFAASAFMTFVDVGGWPKTWPGELEEFRDQAWTLDGPVVTQRYYIAFESREEFERAWPVLLRTRPRNGNSAIHLVSAIKLPAVAVKLDDSGAVDAKMTVCISENDPKLGGMAVPALELAVDGTIVDLNRIPLPHGTPIEDLRFPRVTFEMGEMDTASKP